MNQEIKPTGSSSKPMDVYDTTILKAVFKDNDHLLKTVRALFFGLELTADEIKLIKNTFSSKTLMKVMWDRFLPSLSKDAPIGQMGDRYLGIEAMISGVHRDTVKQVIEYKQQSHILMEQALELLEDPTGEKINLEYDFDIPDEVGSRMLARNQYIRHVESQLSLIKVITDMKDETVEQAKERLKKNSSQ